MKPIKKTRLSNRDSHPPSRAWIIYQNDLKLWKDLNGLQGTSSGSEAVDERLRKKFGQFKGDDTARSTFRTRAGDPVKADDSQSVTVELPNVEPTKQFDPVKYASEGPEWL